MNGLKSTWKTVYAKFIVSVLWWHHRSKLETSRILPFIFFKYLSQVHVSIAMKKGIFSYHLKVFYVRNRASQVAQW